MIKDNIWMIAVVLFITGLMVIAIVIKPVNNKYHCHAKNHKLYESIEPAVMCS